MTERGWIGCTTEREIHSRGGVHMREGAPFPAGDQWAEWRQIWLSMKHGTRLGKAGSAEIIWR